jgi:hypothetical protein
LSTGMGKHRRERNLSLWRNEWHCTLLLMDPQVISIDPIAKNMVDTKYEKERLKFFYFLSRWECTWAVRYWNCVSHMYVAWFLHFALTFWLIFSFIRMPTRNWHCSMKQRSRIWTRHIRGKRRALYIATGKSGILCGPWRLVQHTYIWPLYYWVLLLFCVSQDHLNENSQPTLYF